MTYRENVSRLARKLGLSNDPGLREEDIAVAAVIFFDDKGNTTSIPATDLNRAGRLFIEDRAGGCETFRIDEAFRQDAAEFFAELWEKDPVPGKRKFLDAIRAYSQAQIVWKE